MSGTGRRCYWRQLTPREGRPADDLSMAIEALESVEWGRVLGGAQLRRQCPAANSSGRRPLSTVCDAAPLPGRKLCSGVSQLLPLSCGSFSVDHTLSWDSMSTKGRYILA